MSDEDECVTEKLCKSRRETRDEQINGLKRTIYVSALCMTTVIEITILILNYLRPR